MVTIRSQYEPKWFSCDGPWGDTGFLEDYTAQVGGEPIAFAALITSNAAGQTKHIAANYRPLSSLLLLSRLLGEKFAGTPYAEYPRQRVLTDQDADKPERPRESLAHSQLAIRRSWGVALGAGGSDGIPFAGPA